jgi:hypothetical protein
MTKAIHTLTGLLGAEDVKPCNHSREKEVGDFLYGCQVFSLLAMTACVSGLHHPQIPFPLLWSSSMWPALFHPES